MKAFYGLAKSLFTDDHEYNYMHLHQRIRSFSSGGHSLIDWVILLWVG